MQDWKERLRAAVAIKGSQAQLAADMEQCGAKGVSQSKISWLLMKAEHISAEDALAIDRATSGEVRASDLRPDIWPTPAHVPTAA